MKLFYFLLTAVVLFSTVDQTFAQRLSTNETKQFKEVFDKHLLDILKSATAKIEADLQRGRNFSTLSDSIYTFSKVNEGDPYAPALNFYFTFEVEGTNAKVTEVMIKVLDGSLPVQDITAIPTYDAQNRVSKITMNTPIFGNILNYYFKFDSAGNTTSVILESPGILGQPTSYVGDSVSFSYNGNRISGYNLYTINEDGEWEFTFGVSDITYSGNNATSLTQYYPGEDPDNPVVTPIFRFRNMEWYNAQMPANVFAPLNQGNDLEANLIGIEIAVADESYKMDAVAYIQETYDEGEWLDSTVVRTFEQESDRFTILDAYYDTGDFIYTSVTNYNYDASGRLSEQVVLFDLNIGSPIPLDKTEYEHNDLDILTRQESFTFDQGDWVSTSISEFEIIVENDQLLRYIETYRFDMEYESYRTDYFPSDILGSSTNETLLSDDVVRVFPTNTTSQLMISFPSHDQVDFARVSVIDLNGKTLLSQKSEHVIQNIEINVSTLPAGVYLLHVGIPEGMRTVKFIKN